VNGDAAIGGTDVSILHRQRSADGRQRHPDRWIAGAHGKEFGSKNETKGEVMRLVDSILMEIEQEAQTTKRVLDRVPEDKLAWKPHPKAFSLGQLALHIASVPGSVAAAAVPDTMEAPNFSHPEAKSRQEVLDTFSKSLESAKDTLKKMDDARLMSMWSLTKNGKVLMSVPRIGFIRSILMNHNYHHRGQLSVYLRMLNVPVPSIYGPSADENPFG
jgi:uncharacterized damage-inducible protein DinB